jgi:serine phosphatase RsbU (regulator of sigma subunit)
LNKKSLLEHKNNKNKKNKEFQDFIVFNKSDGILSAHIPANSFPAIDSLGLIWIPTTAGISIIDPANIPINQKIPPVVVQEARFDDSFFLFDLDGIVVPKGNQRYEIHYAALSYYAPEKIKYKYKLEGYDQDWIDAGSRRVAFYTNLPPGKYNFQVVAANNDNIWNLEGASFSFIQDAYFYQTKTFYILLIAFISLSIYLVFRYRVVALKDQKIALENIVNQKTLHLKQQAQELSTLNKIAHVINREYHLEKVLNTLVEQGVNLFQEAKSGFFLLYNNESKTFSIEATIGIEITEPFNSYFEPSEPNLGIIAESFREIEKGIYLIKGYKNKCFGTFKNAVAFSMEVNNEAGGYIILNGEADKIIGSVFINKLKMFREHALSAYSKAIYFNKIENQKAQLQSYFTHTSESIRYAQKLQEAILPPVEYLQQNLNNCFVILLPKDVVSGDFYWISKINDLVILIVVDCTGHGVPGAFMSMLGNSFLNQIINIDMIYDPAEILSRLDKMTKSTFQSGNDFSTDGMDAAVCVIDKNNNKIAFAGAKRPLYYIQEGAVGEIKGNRYSIAGLSHEEKRFTNHSLALNALQSFYLFSDGITDQVGEVTGRKMMANNVKELLSSVYEYPAEVQKERIIEAIKEWQGSTEQIDDMLMIGYVI